MRLYRRTNIRNATRSNRNKKESAPFLRVCKGKSLLEPSNNNTDQVDVAQATTTHFQEEIFMNILSRLPVRYLLQCKCVSKLWYALISDPYFKMMHLERAKNDRNSQKLLVDCVSSEDNKDYLYCCPLSSTEMVEDVQQLVNPVSGRQRFRIECCCDGLVVVEVSDAFNEIPTILMLWNPLTRETVALASPELRQDKPSLYGLGYDSTSSDYKILNISTDNGEGSNSEILALKGGAWRKIGKHGYGISNMLSDMHNLAFVHGAFHWIGKSTNPTVVSFSISSEVYGEIPLSQQLLSCFKDKRRPIGVAVLDGMLFAYFNLPQGEMNTYKFWVLKDYGIEESWSPLLTIAEPLLFFVVPKYWLRNGEILFWCYDHGPPSHGNVFRTISGPFVHCSRGRLQDGLAFTESLISPKSLTN